MIRIRLVLFATLAVLGACSSYSDRMTDVVAAYRAGDYETAAADLDALGQSDSSNAHLYSLERGVVDLALDQPKRAIAAFTFGRDQMDRIGSPGFLDWFGAALTDDTWLAYGGDDYEKILVRAMLAITDLVLGGHDADAYALQVWDRQQQIIDEFDSKEQAENPKRNYRMVGFGSYVRAILLEDDPLSKDAAAREYDRVVSLEPGFEHGEAALDRIRNGTFAPPGFGVVHVIGAVGLGPVKVEVEEPVSTNALAIAQVVWGIIRDRFTFPNISAVKIPQLVVRRDNPSELHVTVGDQDYGPTEVVTDVNAVALQQFKTVRDWIVARAVIRRAVKIAVIEGAKEVAAHNYNDGKEHRRYGDGGNPWVNLGIDVLGNIWTAAERADTRSWTFLPASFQTARLELPAGDHEITIRAGVSGRPTGAAQTVRVRVRDGRTSFVVALSPTPAGGPPPLTSHPAHDATDAAEPAESAESDESAAP